MGKHGYVPIPKRINTKNGRSTPLFQRIAFIRIPISKLCLPRHCFAPCQLYP